jgi:endonuclease-8
MPEGDTIHQIRAALAPHLVGVPLVALRLERQPVAKPDGLLVTACEAVGKHLLLHLGPVADHGGEATVVRVHLGMKGTWHSYRHGEPWDRHPERARVVLATAARVFVCFDPKEVEVARSEAARRLSGALGRSVGPDLLAGLQDGAPAAIDDLVARARAPDHARTAIADLLLTQSVASGLGNVYKSELLFLLGVDPFTPVAAVSDATLAGLYRLGTHLLADNTLKGGWRVTTGARALDAVTGPRGDRLRNLDLPGVRQQSPLRGGRPGATRHWVYRRAGRPCLVCGTRIQSRIQGSMARMTYWCARCQPAIRVEMARSSW